MIKRESKGATFFGVFFRMGKISTKKGIKSAILKSFIKPKPREKNRAEIKAL